MAPTLKGANHMKLYFKAGSKALAINTTDKVFTTTDYSNGEFTVEITDGSYHELVKKCMADGYLINWYL